MSIRVFFAVLSAIASVLTIVLAFTGHLTFPPNAFYYLLATIVFMILFFKIYNFILIRKEQYETIFYHIKWIQIDKTHSKYDVVKVIKSNRPYLSHIEIKHTWTGDGDIEIENDKDGTYVLKKDFPNMTVTCQTSLLFNEIKAIHYTLITNDRGGKQKNYMNCGGKRPIDMLVLEACILHDDCPKTAKVLTSGVHEQKSSARQIAILPIDEKTHTFRWEKINFPGDENYWLDWEE